MQLVIKVGANCHRLRRGPSLERETTPAHLITYILYNKTVKSQPFCPCLNPYKWYDEIYKIT